MNETGDCIRAALASRVTELEAENMRLRVALTNIEHYADDKHIWKIARAALAPAKREETKSE